jgi:VIT1/CCC1 family predicted Fe2+/Mn2+ transporter
LLLLLLLPQVTLASTVALGMFGAFGAWAGGSSKLMGAMRVVLGGLLAMGATYAVGSAFKLAMDL